jgi:hypothetical protein
MRAIALVLVIAGITVKALAVLFPDPPPPPRHHTYYCMVSACIQSGPYQYCQSQTDICSAFSAIEMDI